MTRIERRQVYHYEVYPISVEGAFKSTYHVENEYWLVRGSHSEPLQHLSDTHYDHQYLAPILTVAGTDLWVAFRLDDVQFSEVGVRIDVFDRTGILYTQRLSNVVRLARCARCFDSLDSYSIRGGPGNHTIRIDTTSGTLSYDVRNNILRSDG